MFLYEGDANAINKIKMIKTTIVGITAIYQGACHCENLQTCMLKNFLFYRVLKPLLKINWSRKFRTFTINLN